MRDLADPFAASQRDWEAIKTLGWRSSHKKLDLEQRFWVAWTGRQPWTQEVRFIRPNLRVSRIGIVPNVRCWHEADVTAALTNVRSW